MSSGERPIGAAKGKQSDTEALCQPPPPPFREHPPMPPPHPPPDPAPTEMERRPGVGSPAPVLMEGGGIDTGGALCAVPALSAKSILDPFSPDGQGDRGNYCVPIRGTDQTQFKNSDYESKRTVFPTTNAGSLFKSAVFAPWT